jgi:hypothetical protein
MIFLAICPVLGPEVHIKWKGHETVAAATAELQHLRKLLMGQKKKPYDCYVYEAEAPPWGLKAHELDEVDMNFYQESDPADLEAVQRDLNKAIHEVGILAEEERKAAKAAAEKKIEEIKAVDQQKA